MKDFAAKKVLVVGLGDSGLSAALLLKEHGADVTVIDSLKCPARMDSIPLLEEREVRLELGVDVPSDILKYELVVTSPGVPANAPALKLAIESGLRMISELELGSRLIDGPIVAITGTNGKTTTTKMVGEILLKSGFEALICGNIGNPITNICGKTNAKTIVVAEVSSFQLAFIDKFKPHISAILNIAPDHYDWHGNFNDYLTAKGRIVENQEARDYVIYLREDENLRNIVSRARAKAIGFSLKKESGVSIFIEGGWIKARKPFGKVDVMPVDEIRLKGVHNRLNVIAASAIALVLGCKPEAIREAVGSFTSLEHRMEPVTSFDGIEFYNDSKGTNPHATINALSSFSKPVVLIAGGRNKGIDFSPLAGVLKENFEKGMLKGLVLFGESSTEISREVEEKSPELLKKRTVVVDSIENAVKQAMRMIEKGVVLFSPACASFDMYRDYKERGEEFKKSVMKVLSTREGVAGK
ncbi:MAG: UDP-N-acetylmuramoyl-L-alanine--D-glutamate ligase [Actinomycetota bacterium]|nr:UDP-N-acetylmuramoyl-L-alanine--D-glutamate ligase [Actinomycetota bacterium]